MNAAMVMMVALAGLGGNNQTAQLGDDVSGHSAVLGPYTPYPGYTTLSPYTNPYPAYTTPSTYSGYYAAPRSYDLPEYTSPWGVIRSTICSFLIGHDPDVPTVAEIESSVYGDPPGR